MEPPSSDAEALRDQETAQIRASNGLLVAADEFCDLECSHQPVGQSALTCGASAAPRAISAVCAESVYVVFLIGSSAQLWHQTLLFNAEFNGD